jgi:hypothetical protein
MPAGGPRSNDAPRPRRRPSEPHTARIASTTRHAGAVTNAGTIDAAQRTGPRVATRVVTRITCGFAHRRSNLRRRNTSTCVSGKAVAVTVIVVPSTTATTSCAQATGPTGRPQRGRPDNRVRARHDPRCGGRPQASRPPRRVLPDDSGAIGRARSGAGQDCVSRESVSWSDDLAPRPTDQIASAVRVSGSIQGAILRMVPLPTVATIPPSSATEKSPPPLAQRAVCGVVGCERENARRKRRPRVPLVPSACGSAAQLAADRAAYERSLSATGIPPT